MLFLLNFSKVEARDSTPMPIFYPEGVISDNKPYFIWQDRYNKRDKKIKAQYRISLENEDNSKIKPVIIQPKLYYKYFYAAKLPKAIPEGRYNYTIERLLYNKSTDSKHFYYLRYPIKGEFVVDNKKMSDLDKLPPEFIIKYIYIDNHNRYINGYNSIFFGTSGALTFGLGLIFYSVLDFGIISSVISGLCFISSAVGLSASGYYGYHYFDKKNELQKIIDIGKKTSIKGSISQDAINAEIELLF